MTEHLLIGLEKIHKLLCDENGVSAMSLQTFQRKYVPDMKRVGVIMRLNIGSSKNPRLCAWPSQVQSYFQLREQNKWGEDEKRITTGHNYDDITTTT